MFFDPAAEEPFVPPPEPPGRREEGYKLSLIHI